MTPILIRFLICCALLCPSISFAGTYYVDGAVSSSGNGLSWATAWKALTNITGLSAGDTVYISGGSTYAVSGWNPTSGTAGNPITYKIGQDSGHNGTATFNLANGQLPTSPYTIFSGDAGDGNIHFVLSGVLSTMNDVLELNSNIRISYVAFGSVRGMVRNVGSVINGFELDHCTAHGNYDGLIYWDNNGSSCSAYGSNSFHHNTFGLSHRTTYGETWAGSDGVQGSLACTDFYDNEFNGVADNQGVNHQDAFQTSAGGTGGTVWVRVFNNKITNMGNSGIYFENWASPNIMRHIRIYNNVIEFNDPNLQGYTNRQAIPMGNSSGSGWVWDDVMVANNTIVGTGSAAASIAMYNVGGTVSNVFCRNNIAVDGNNVDLGSNVVGSNNVRVAGSGAAGHFVTYSPMTAGNDFHLVSGDTTFKDQGMSLSTYFTTDKDGNTRTGTWDIGAYEYGASGGDVTAPTVTSVSVNGSTATINFYETVVTTGYDTGDFNLDCTSPTLTNVALSSPSGTGSTRTFTIATPIVYGQTCNLDYVGSAGDITDAASSPNSMVAVNDISVTNLTGAEFVESGWYTQIADTALLPGYAAYGTTIMLPYNGAYSPDSIPVYLNAAAAVGIKVWVDLRIEALALSESAFKAIINANKNHSALKGWYISDEPELGGTSPATVTQYYNWAKSQDPNHPVAIAHANEPNAAYVGGYDVLVIDYYPGWTVSLPAEYNWMVRASYSRWKAGVDFAAAYGKTFIPAGLGFGYKISDGSLNNGVRDLTYGEYRYHVFSGIVQGVPAYLFWMDEWANSNVKSLVGQMINQINDISIPMRSGATNTAAITCSQPTSKIQYRYGVSGNTHTLLAVNIAGYNVSDSGETLNNVTFTLPSGASTVTVLDESRTLTPSSSIITDNFSRFQVHVYQWTTSSVDYTAPTVTITTSDPQAIVSDSLSVAWTDSDAVGVTLRKWRVGGYPSDSVGTTATSPATTSGYAQGANTLYVGARDAAGNWGYDYIVVNRDSIAPIIDNLSPSGVLACTSNPRNVTLSLTTNETASARMSITDVSYGSMSTFTNTNSTSHSEIKSLACGASYTYYVRTSDAIGNVNTSSSLISFSIASPQIAGPGGIRMIGGVKLTH